MASPSTKTNKHCVPRRGIFKAKLQQSRSSDAEGLDPDGAGDAAAPDGKALPDAVLQEDAALQEIVPLHEDHQADCR